MFHVQLLASLSPEKQQFVLKSYNGIFDNTESTIPERENQKRYFLQLVNENKQLSEYEKNYCREKYIYDFELNSALYELGKPFECKKCKLTRYSNKFCEKCISLHLQS